MVQVDMSIHTDQRAFLQASGSSANPHQFIQAFHAFPDKAITFVLPFAAGSATDQFAQALGKAIADETGQPVVIDNKAGASGRLATKAVARVAADGQTLLFTYVFSPPWRRAGLRDMAARRTRWPVSLKAPARAADSAVTSCRSRR